MQSKVRDGLNQQKAYMTSTGASVNRCLKLDQREPSLGGGRAVEEGEGQLPGGVK